MTSVLLNSARAYYHAGLPPVPLCQGRPLTSWRPFIEAYPSWDVIATLPWDQADGIGLVLGHAAPGSDRRWLDGPPFRWWALDIEAEHVAEAEAWLDDECPGWREGLVAESQSGGVHLYLLTLDPGPSRRCRWGDVKATGGLVYAPPTRRFKAAAVRDYAWRSAPALDRFAEEAPMRALILDPIQVPAAGGGPGVPATTNGHQPFDVTQALNGAPYHERNTTLFRLVAKLRAADVPFEWAVRLVAEAAAKCDPPWGALPEDRESVEDLVARVYRRYAPGATLIVPATDGAGSAAAGKLVDGNGTEAAGDAPAQTPAQTPAGAVELFVAADTLVSRFANQPDRSWLPFIGLSGYVGAGLTTLLSGRPKAGKSTLLAHAVKGWLAAGKTVAWLSEDPPAVWVERCAVLGLSHPALHLGFPRLDTPPDRWLLGLRRLRPDVIVVDTIRAFCDLQDENSAAEVHAKLFPFILLGRELSAAMILVHHRNKHGAGDEGLDHAGSHAFVGDVDVALSLRETADADRRRELVARSRFDETPRSLVLELSETDGQYRAIGTPDGVRLAEVQDRLRQALADAGGEWRTTVELIAALDEPRPSREQARRALLALALAGTVERQPGTGKAPDRWRLGPSPRGPSSPPPPSPSGPGSTATAPTPTPASASAPDATAAGDPSAVAATTAYPTPGSLLQQGGTAVLAATTVEGTPGPLLQQVRQGAEPAALAATTAPPPPGPPVPQAGAEGGMLAARAAEGTPGSPVPQGPTDPTVSASETSTSSASEARAADLAATTAPPTPGPLLQQGDRSQVLALAARANYPRFWSYVNRCWYQGSEGWRVFVQVASDAAVQEAWDWLVAHYPPPPPPPPADPPPDDGEWEEFPL